MRKVLQEACRVQDGNDLRPRAACDTLPVQPIRIEPEKRRVRIPRGECLEGCFSIKVDGEAAHLRMKLRVVDVWVGMTCVRGVG